MQTLEAELRRQGKGRLGDPRALRGVVREVVRRSLRNLGDLEIPEKAASVAEPEVGSPVLPRMPDSRDRPVEDADARFGRPWSGPLVVRPRQACEMLSIGMTRLYELLNEGQLQSLRYGRARRVTTASIHAFIERHAHADPIAKLPR